MSDGIDQVRKAFDAYFASEAKLYRPTNCTVLAECCGVLGQPEFGLAMIDEAVSCMTETNERMTEVETWRVKGELAVQLAAQSVRTGKHLDSQEEAEACFRRAIETARGQKAKIWELRATVSLARLLERSERKSEAQKVLAEIHGWFSEGSETPDLQQARSLLEALSS